MEERCGKLYKAIKVAFEDMSVRQNVNCLKFYCLPLMKSLKVMMLDCLPCT